VGEYPRRDHLTGMLPGCEHTGQPSPPMRENLELLHSCCYLVARWILVWDKEPESVCITHSPNNHAPTFKPKESLA
jgi:hypothetical protein